jgi:hypothetical protein
MDRHHFADTRFVVKRRIRIRIRTGVTYSGAIKDQNGAMKGCGPSQLGPRGSKMDPWRVCMAVVADFYHFDEEQDPDPEQHQIKGKTGFGSTSKRIVGSKSAST